jgi:hypothetical protein
MRRSALSLLVIGVLLVGGFLELLQARSLPIISFILLIGGAVAVAVSIWILLPSYPESVQKRLAQLEAMTEEQRQTYLGRFFRKLLLVFTVVLLSEIPVAALSWSYVDWRPGIVATTVLFLVLLVGLILRRRIPARE